VLLKVNKKQELGLRAKSAFVDIDKSAQTQQYKETIPQINPKQ